MTLSGVTLITCTGGRPFAFGLCQKFMLRQTYRGRVQWIVVNDVERSVEAAHVQDGWLLSMIFPEPRWKPGENTLARNLLAATPEVLYEKVLFIEDDDWYASNYVDLMAAKLDFADIIGEACSRYYHVPSRRYRVFNNACHASLCQTGIRKALLPELRDVCETPMSSFIDFRLWQHRLHPLTDTRGCVGIKGLPGREGIGIGHRPVADGNWRGDADLETLKAWIGDDVKLYEGICH